MKIEHVRRIALCVALAGGVVVGAPKTAFAQSQEELKQARELFQEAYKDEQEKRFEQALEKFRRVAKVRESASVRYRIASCLESLGRLREARDAFRALAASKATLAQNEHDVADSAATRVPEIEKKIPHVIIKLDPSWPPDTRVTVDGGLVPASSGPRGVEVDPGEHTIGAMSPKTGPAESKVTAAVGGEITVNLLPPAAPPPPPPPPGGEEPEKPPATTGSNKTLGWVLLGAGGAFIVGGAVMLAVRKGKISTIEETCPNKVCPTASKAAVDSATSTAETMGPLGIGFLVVGVVAGGFGTYILLKPSANAAPPPAPTAGRASGLKVRASSRSIPGGGVLGVEGSF